MMLIPVTAWGLALLSFAATDVQAQEDEASVPWTCPTCAHDPTESILQPGTIEARRAIFAQLGESREESQEATLPSCGTLALIAGAVTAAGMMLLAAVFVRAIPSDNEASDYLVAAGIGFGIGAGSVLVRCLVEGSREGEQPGRPGRSGLDGVASRFWWPAAWSRSFDPRAMAP